MNQCDVLTDINCQIDEQANLLVWQQKSSILNQNTAIKIIIFSFILLMMLAFISLSYALIAFILWLVCLPVLIYSARPPRIFWHYDKSNYILRLYKQTEMLKEIACDNLALSVRAGERGGAYWILVSPKVGDMETLLVTGNGLLSGKYHTSFSETANRLAQYMGLRRSIDI